MGKYYISDMHLGHENVLRHDGRPFKNVEEMNKALIDNWNNVVNYDDEVYILGDFAWKKDIGLEAISQLKGKKYLIKGNHDRISDEMADYFIWIKDMAIIKDNGIQVVLCHYPIADWYNQYHYSIQLYGHVHGNTTGYQAFEKYREICRKLEIPFECYNVGCMMPYMNYTPRTLSQIINSGAGNNL